MNRTCLKTPRGRVAAPGVTAAVLILMVSGCAAPPPAPPVPTGIPAGFPAERYLSPAVGEVVYEVDPGRSLVQVYVYRGGTLARMGHDHVVASRDVSGFVLLRDGDHDDSRFAADLFAALAAMTVDEAALRAEAGFTTEPSESDREGTRGNMLKSLEAADYPFVSVAIDSASGTVADVANGALLDVSLTLHGVTRELRLPVVLERQAASITASGSFELLQSDFGITPFSVLGGALAVQDKLDLRFEIHAERVSPTAISLLDPSP